MAWVTPRRGVLTYSGRLTRPSSFEAWAETDGRARVNALASKQWFSLLGKRRTAKRQLWRELRQSGESGALADEIRHAVLAYTARMGEFALSSSSLPRGTVDLRRLFVVPRARYNAWTFEALVSLLRRHPETAALAGGLELMDYFALELICAIDTALFSASPSVRRVLTAGAEWSIVGANAQVVWSVPLRQGPDWRGHFFIYEAAAERMTRAQRKQLTACIERLDTRVRGLSRQAKSAILGGI